MKDLQRSDVLGDVMNAKKRRAGGETGKAGRDRSNELSFNAALDERTEKLLSRDADKYWAAKIQDFTESGDDFDVLARRLPEPNSGIENNPRRRNSGLLGERERAREKSPDIGDDID
jgi:hypothetical protein